MHSGGEVKRRLPERIAHVHVTAILDQVLHHLDAPRLHDQFPAIGPWTTVVV